MLQVGELCLAGGKAQRTGLWEENGNFIAKSFLINVYYFKDKEILCIIFFPVTSHHILICRAKA